jgi:hypothetical protein
LYTTTAWQIKPNCHIIIIISLLISPVLGTGLPYGLFIMGTGHNPPRGPGADYWWLLKTVNAAGTYGLTCLPKHGGARNNKLNVKYSCILDDMNKVENKLEKFKYFVQPDMLLYKYTCTFTQFIFRGMFME